MITGHLKIIVLKNLSKGELSGYDLMKAIQKAGFSRPSAGSIYPLLEDLSINGLVSKREAGRKKIYSLTRKGRLILAEMTKRKDEIIDRILDGIKIFESMSREKGETGLMMDMLNRIKKGEIPFSEVNPEINELQMQLHTVMAEGRIKRNRISIKKILKNTALQLRKLK